MLGKTTHNRETVPSGPRELPGRPTGPHSPAPASDDPPQAALRTGVSPAAPGSAPQVLPEVPLPESRDLAPSTLA